MALRDLCGSAVTKLRRTPKSCRSPSWSQFTPCPSLPGNPSRNAAGTGDVNVVVSPEAAPRATSCPLQHVLAAQTLRKPRSIPWPGVCWRSCSAAVLLQCQGTCLPDPNQSPTGSSSHEVFPFGSDRAGQIQRCSLIPSHAHCPHGWSRKPFLRVVVIRGCWRSSLPSGSSLEEAKQNQEFLWIITKLARREKLKCDHCCSLF